MTAVLASLADRASARSVEDRVPAAKLHLSRVAQVEDYGWISWERPGPSAAFSRRDTALPGFAAAVESVSARGFEPFIRPVGGRLAVYDGGCLVLNVLSRNADPRPGTTARFQSLADAIAAGLAMLGLDARVGAVPGEYCPGDWSVNAGGTHKIAGLGQRMSRHAVLATAVVVVGSTEPLRQAMQAAYDDLGLDFDPGTVGSVSEFVPGVTPDDVQDVIEEAFGEHVELGMPNPLGRRRLLSEWDPR